MAERRCPIVRQGRRNRSCRLSPALWSKTASASRTSPRHLQCSRGNDASLHASSAPGGDPAPLRRMASNLLEIAQAVEESHAESHSRTVAVIPT